MHVLSKLLRVMGVISELAGSEVDVLFGAALEGGACLL